LTDRIVLRQIRVSNPYDECNRGFCDGSGHVDNTEYTGNVSWIFKYITNKNNNNNNNNNNTLTQGVGEDGRRRRMPVKAKSSATPTTSSSSGTATAADNNQDETIVQPISKHCHGSAADWVKYLKQEDGQNTPTRTSALVKYSGGGFMQYMDLSLRSVQNGTKLLAPIAEHEAELVHTVAEYDASLMQSYECAIQQMREISKSGWFDELTRAIYVEYCVAPYFSVVNHTDNIGMRATGRFQILETNDDDDGDDGGKRKRFRLKKKRPKLSENGIGACHRLV